MALRGAWPASPVALRGAWPVTWWPIVVAGRVCKYVPIGFFKVLYAAPSADAARARWPIGNRLGRVPREVREQSHGRTVLGFCPVGHAFVPDWHAGLPFRQKPLTACHLASTNPYWERLERLDCTRLGSAQRSDQCTTKAAKGDVWLPQAHLRTRFGAHGRRQPSRRPNSDGAGVSLATAAKSAHCAVGSPDYFPRAPRGTTP